MELLKNCTWKKWASTNIPTQLQLNSKMCCEQKDYIANVKVHNNSTNYRNIRTSKIAKYTVFKKISPPYCLRYNFFDHKSILIIFG